MSLPCSFFNLFVFDKQKTASYTAGWNKENPWYNSEWKYASFHSIDQGSHVNFSIAHAQPNLVSYGKEQKKKNHHIVAPKKDNPLNYSLSFGIKACIPKIFN